MNTNKIIPIKTEILRRNRHGSSVRYLWFATKLDAELYRDRLGKRDDLDADGPYSEPEGWRLRIQMHIID